MFLAPLEHVGSTVDSEEAADAFGVTVTWIGRGDRIVIFGDGGSERDKFGDLPVQIRQLPGEQFPHMDAGIIPRIAHLQDDPDLRQGESGVSTTVDEIQPAHGLVPIITVSIGSPVRGRKKSPILVKPECLGRHPGRRSGFANTHGAPFTLSWTISLLTFHYRGRCRVLSRKTVPPREAALGPVFVVQGGFMPDSSVPVFDLAIIGSGGGAFAAAIRATNLGKRVVMVERGTIGGTCVNTGCVPSKALLAAADARHVALDSGRFPGIVASANQVDMPELIGGKRALVETMRAGKYVDLINDYGWELRHGVATFTGTASEPMLTVTGDDGAVHTVRADHYLVATGSSPWAPPIDGLADVHYLTSTTAMELEELPESLLVIGGGYVALEQAQLFARLGSKVTMLVRSRLASAEEPEASRALAGVFADEGIRVVRRAQVTAVRTDQSTGGVVATAMVDGGQEEFRASTLLVATGRRPVTEGLNLGAVGVETGEKGEIVVDRSLASTNPRIWAAGDVTGHREFVYVAANHGAMVVENAFNNAGREVDYAHLPRVTFTSPALAAVGMTDKEANTAGISCQCGVVPLEYVPRALVNRDTRGFIKIVADHRTGRIVGITAVAKDAGEIAAAGVYILEAGMTVDQVARMWSPYLTMAEGIKIAAQSFSTDVSRLSCCAA